MAKERTTKKQQELLQFITDFISEHGYGPSYREIMRGLDYKSVSTVAVHVDGLIARGWLNKRTHSARSLEVVSGGMAASTPADTQDESQLTSQLQIYSTEEVLMQRCNQLLDADGSHEDLSTLVECFRILGYEKRYKEYVDKRNQYAQKHGIMKENETTSSSNSALPAAES